MSRFSAATLVFLLGTTELRADDRPPLVRNPVFVGKKPQYLLLAFGPKADLRLWAALDIHHEWCSQKPTDKDALYIDLNGNGDLTDPGERFPAEVVPRLDWDKFSMREHEHFYPRFTVPTLTGRDGTKYTNLVVDVGWYVFGQRYREVNLKVQVPGRGEQWSGGMQLRLGDRPERAPEVHFNGPLTMRVNMTTGLMICPVSYDEKVEAAPPREEEQPFFRGKDCFLYTVIGTDGSGAGTFVPLMGNIPPARLHPVAEIEFPHREPAKPSMKVTATLDRRCCGTQFYAPVLVPADAALGPAKVTLSYPAWKAGEVFPAVGTVTVADPIKP